MTNIGLNESPGDNLEFNVATASDVTIYLSDSSKSSADDTATSKYSDNPKRRKVFCLRSNKAIQIVSINGVTFTNPITCIANGSITEKWDTPLLFKMAIRVISDDTNLKLRVR